MKEKLFAAIQYVLPHHLISRAVHYFVECQIPWFKNHLIQWAIDHYHVDMNEAQREKAKEYRHFNDFFPCLLKDGVRLLPEDPELIVGPADGVISQLGDINDGRIFQAKGHDYSLVIWDARSPEEYRGEKVMAMKAGHIPGAINFEWTRATMDPERNYRIRENLTPELAALGLSPDKNIITHCQAHHRSGFTYLVAKSLGFKHIRAYDCSWSEWGNLPETPVATGR